MPLTEDLLQEGHEILDGPFTVSPGRAIPSVQDIALGTNEGRQLRLVALFVDIRKSTAIVHHLGLVRAARVYKAYMRAVTRIVRARSGELLSFNGDGVAAGFVGDDAPTEACLTAMNLYWFLERILKPRVDATLRQFHAPPELSFDFGIGVEVGDVLVVRGGIRGNDNSDLVWAGNPVNYAVKLSSLGTLPYSIHISNNVFVPMHYELFSDGTTQFWESHYWAEKDMMVWRTQWWFRPDYLSTAPISESAGAVLRHLLPPARL
jgi:class 3 adenylate cyclase